MAILKVNPNRMELSRLRSKLKIANKGYKLLKDKQEQLIRHFFILIKDYKKMRKEVEESLIKAYQSFLIAKSSMGESNVEQAILKPTLESSVITGKKQIMNLEVPTFEISLKGSPFCYSLIETTVELDESVEIFSHVLKKLLLLAEYEQSIILLAEEIITTRRRVNALEYILVPDLEDTIKDIKNKLSEMERAAIVQLMFINKKT